MLFKRKTYILNENCLFPQPINPESLRNYIENNYFYEISPEYKGFFGYFKAFFEIKEVEENEECNSREKYEGPRQIYFSHPPTKERLEQLQKEQEEFIRQNSFSNTLRKIISERNLNHIDVYKSANIDRKLFSKIINNIYYTPSKKTIISLAIGLKLDFDGTQSLLSKAGFTLSKNILSDVIITYCIENGIYDINIINNALFSCNQKLLCS